LQTSALVFDQTFAVLAAGRSTPSASPSSTTTELGPTQRIPIVLHGKVVGTAIVRLPTATALPDAIAFRSEVIRLLLLGGALGAMLSFALGIFFARRTTRPVREVTGAVRALASGDRSVRLQAGRPDEFGDMGRAFNSMADAIDDEEQLRQGFAGEVAHELRTPLTILRTQVEGLRVGVLQPTPEALGSLDEEVRRMSRLVADLQILGSADAAGFSLERDTVDLRELVDEGVREFAGLFEGSEVRLETRLEPATAWVDRVRVGQILANLLSNALKFTPAGGLVRVELDADDSGAVIRVSDSGPGIPADELPHVFERFFRGRTARPSGSGIGLTVVRELVEAQGGTVEVFSTPGHGTTFTVRLTVQPMPSEIRRTDFSQPLATVPL
jgi:two-component system OmpR family sensor kinase/two-component system sensor histidine kinase BaeS